MTIKPDIRKFTREELITIITDIHKPEFRARQLYEWIWKKGAVDFESMSDIPKNLRFFLSDEFSINPVVISSSERSRDRSIKYIFKLHDNQLVEGVLIPSNYRNTICISSQVGCQLACTFCATGLMGFRRNLTFDEIFDQVRLLNDECVEKYGKKISNIVFMGMGEPLLNYPEVSRAIQVLSTPESLGISPQRFTISTAGLPDQIKQIAKDGLKVNLALSLNSANDLKRNELMPVNKTYPLDKLHDALSFYQDKIKNIITLEYILIKGINDGFQDVKDIVKFTKGLRVKINLIEYNPIENTGFKRASLEQLNFFKGLLEEQNYIVNIRNSRGKDIAAACGQLATQRLKTRNSDNRL
jgi:23S rRNA (adenine2503-C2)-methyltransferase